MGYCPHTVRIMREWLQQFKPCVVPLVSNTSTQELKTVIIKICAIITLCFPLPSGERMVIDLNDDATKVSFTLLCSDSNSWCQALQEFFAEDCGIQVEDLIQAPAPGQDG
jgi:hypothetical protein